MQINDKLDQILQASTFAQAGGLIGRTISSDDGSVTGVVKEVRLISDGIIAVLESGAELPVTPGVVLS